jgi:uncharacterized protein (DUF1810 family)
MNEPHNLQRFATAQDSVYENVLSELRQGRKTSHWMWFVFPQLKGLGSSAMADEFAIASIGEAQTYLDHPVLGHRLRECTRMVMDVRGQSIEQIFGYPDYLKFRSSMTLFAQAAQHDEVFQAAIAKYFQGNHDPLTIEKLRANAPLSRQGSLP